MLKIQKKDILMIKVSNLSIIAAMTVSSTLATCVLEQDYVVETPVAIMIENIEEEIEEPVEEIKSRKIEPEIVEEEAESDVEPVIEEVIEEEIIVVEEEEVEEFWLTKEEIELIALVTMAEAEGEPEKGKRLVIDTILNRVDHDRFPDTVHGVVYQEDQFTSMSNGRVNKCYVMEEIYDLVLEELENRTNHDVIFFSAYNYSEYGKPMFAVSNHYFSSYSS